MQVSKLLRPGPRTISRKLSETLFAIKMERCFSKKEILCAYLNLAPYGGNLVGARSASLWYFGKEPMDLSLGESAFLAGLPQAPTRLRPDKNPEAAAERRRYVLGRMRARNLADRHRLRAAESEPLPLKLGPAPFQAPHLAQSVLSRRGDEQGRIETCLIPWLQHRAEEGIREEVERLRNAGVSNGSVVVLEVESGNLIALVGSSDFFNEKDQGQVNGAFAPRSPGSALKPFVYAKALDEGWITPDTILPDCPIQFGEYSPVNYDGSFSHMVSMRRALQRSLNIPAVVVMERVGAPRVLESLRSMGLHTLQRPSEEYGYALALGGCEVTLLGLCNAYATLARGGVCKEVRFLRTDPVLEGKRIFSEEASFLIWEILSEVPIERWLSMEALRKVPLPVAWKTGTSYGHRDAWTVGYTPEFVVGVWMGNFSGRPAHGLVGRDAAAPLVARIFRELYGEKDVPVPLIPPGLERRSICSLSGQTSGEHCPETGRGWVIRGVSSAVPCQIHRRLPIDDLTGHVLCRECWQGRSFYWQVFAIWPNEIASFGGTSFQLPRHYAGCRRVAQGSSPIIVAPRQNETYYLLERTRGVTSPMILRAQASSDASRLFWFSNKDFLGCVNPGDGLSWNPDEGSHELRCSDDLGRNARVSFKVARTIVHPK